MDAVRQAIRVRHFSRRTEEAYVDWIRRFIVFHWTRHPRELGAQEVTAFLSSLAARGVSASTQNQALSSVLFLYEVVFGERLGWLTERRCGSWGNCAAIDLKSNQFEIP